MAIIQPVVVGVESEFSNCLWLELSLGQAEQYIADSHV